MPPIRVVTINGSPQSPSKTGLVLDAVVDEIRRHRDVWLHQVEVADLVGEPLAATPDAAGPTLRRQLHAIESADLIIAGSPVYMGSYTGLFKYVLDLVDQYALVDIPVLVVATGGSERHQLVVEHQLRPLFSFFQTTTVPIGVYAHTSEFDGYEISSAALRGRIVRAARRALDLVGVSPSLREVNAAAL